MASGRSNGPESISKSNLLLFHDAEGTANLANSLRPMPSILGSPLDLGPAVSAEAGLGGELDCGC